MQVEGEGVVAARNKEISCRLWRGCAGQCRWCSGWAAIAGWGIGAAVAADFRWREEVRLQAEISGGPGRLNKKEISGWKSDFHP
ncbi:hypothetical protein AAC387_Pa07g2012 [Persea americana]